MEKYNNKFECKRYRIKSSALMKTPLRICVRKGITYVIYGEEFGIIRPINNFPKEYEHKPIHPYPDIDPNLIEEMDQLDVVMESQKQLNGLLSETNRLLYIIEESWQDEGVKMYQGLLNKQLHKDYDKLKEANESFNKIGGLNIYKLEGISSLFEESKSTIKANKKAVVLGGNVSSKKRFEKVFKKGGTSGITLACGHTISKEEIEERRGNNNVPRSLEQFFCTKDNCGHVLNDNEIISIFRNDFYKDGESIDFNASTYIKGEEKFYCVFCAKKFSPGHIVMIHSTNHTFCVKCLKRYLNGTRADLIKCPVRSCHFECSKKYIIDKAREITDQAYELELGKKFKCITCASTANVNDGITSGNCNHYFCKSCFTKEIEKAYNNNAGILNCKCTADGCKAQITTQAIDSIFGDKEDVVHLLEIQSIRKLITIVECPKCHNEFFVPENSKSKDLVCDCKERFCRLCTGKPHKGICPDREKSIEGANERHEKIGPCPYCLELYAKDDRCATVECRSTGEKYCFRCSAKWSPIENHGNHYHRKNCVPDYREYKGETKYSEKCDECKKLKEKLGRVPTQGCPQPKELAKGDIPEEEFPDEFRN